MVNNNCVRHSIYRIQQKLNQYFSACIATLTTIINFNLHIRKGPLQYLLPAPSDNYNFLHCDENMCRLLMRPSILY